MLSPDTRFLSCLFIYLQRSNAFRETKVNEVFSGYQPWHLVKTYWYFRDQVCPHHQSRDVGIFQSTDKDESRKGFSIYLLFYGFLNDRISNPEYKYVPSND
jgi:hypothetical protein